MGFLQLSVILGQRQNGLRMIRHLIVRTPQALVPSQQASQAIDELFPRCLTEKSLKAPVSNGKLVVPLEATVESKLPLQPGLLPPLLLDVRV
mmetsp:Transcript_19544/g.73987  ORF Transcript_19544/g.73987 Transcript_19544/m.73987 type:complete len:92 (-) Transcript_19544:58-333(-)|eukprot:scaffold1503_cov250-Pinguiococcus_pyrenoidosus.AAC.6